MIKILRVEQWTKNLIIFIPAVLSNNFEVFTSYEIYLVFISFSLLASSTYILNDIKDIEQDRIHPEKKYRPLASGSLNVKVATTYSFALLILSFFVIYTVNYDLVILFFVYLIITIFYSSSFKYIKYLDFLSITILFGIRILIGANSATVELTISFVLFLLFVLTLVSIGKKLSILNNSEVSVDSKVKKHLIRSYTDTELHKLCILSSFFSLAIFGFWNFQNANIYTFEFLVSVLSIIVLYYFNKSFIKASLYAKTENFVEWILASKNIITIVFLSLLTLTIIY